MTLKEQITEDMKTAMRAKDSERLGTIRLLLAACKQREVDERIVLDDAAVVGLVDKLIKQRKDSVAAYLQAQRQDLADKESAEIKVLEGYLPQRMGADEIALAVRAIVTELGATGLCPSRRCSAPQNQGRSCHRHTRAPPRAGRRTGAVHHPQHGQQQHRRDR